MNRVFLLICLQFIGIICSAQIQWQPIGANNLNSPVLTMYPDTTNNKLYIGGAFKYYGTLPFNGVCEWDGFQLSNLGCGLGGCAVGACGGVRQFEIFQNALYALFMEDSIGCQRIHHFSKWDGFSWIDLNQNFYWNTSPVTIATLFNSGNELIVTGGFDSINNLRVHGITKFNGLVWDTVFYCNLFTDNYLLIRPSIKYNNEVYAQNNLKDLNGNSQFFSVWRNNCWEKVPGAFSNTSGAIRKMIIYKNELYIAGSFDPNHDPLSPGYSIAKWNGTTWDNLDGGIRLTDPSHMPIVYDMIVYNDELYVAGYFEKAGNLTVSNIAKWNGSNWCSLGSIFDREINSITSFHDSLFIGGFFKTINNDSILFLAKCFVGNYVDTCEVVDIEESTLQHSINIFPSPANNYILIQSDTIKNFNLKISSVTGNILLFEKNAQPGKKIDISQLSEGIYFVILNTRLGTFVKKIIKK